MKRGKTDSDSGANAHTAGRGAGATRDLVAAVAVAAAAVAYTLTVIGARAREGAAPNFDTYAQFYPNAVYALRSWREGSGLLWNGLQNCGAPTLVSSVLGPFYPPHLLLLLVDLDTGMLILFGCNLTIGGLGAFLLCRELGLRRSSAICGGLAFGLGRTTLSLAGWTPGIAAPYVWLPVAAWLCERLAKKPNPARCVQLAAALAVQFLAAHPQVSFFTYQYVALRTGWLLACRPRQAARVALAAVCALALPFLFAAFYLVPAFEYAAQSVRSGALSLDELRPVALRTTWEGFRASLRFYPHAANPFAVMPMALIAVSLLHPARRRDVVFFLLTGALYLALAFDNPLFDLYRQLPFGSKFRMPDRFVWMTAFAGTVLVAAGADAATRTARRGWLALLVLAACGAGTSYALSGATPRLGDWWQLAGVLLAVAAARSGGALPARVALAGVFAVSVWISGPSPFGPIANPQFLYARAPMFDLVKRRLTPQDRIYPLGAGNDDFSIMDKSASLFGVPSISDYEVQTSRRYAELTTRLILDRPMRSLNDFYYRLSRIPRNRPLFDLLAARYVVTDQRDQVLVRWPQAPPFNLLWRDGSLAVYENPAALPRAYFVPRARVVADGHARLERLASPLHDPRRVVLLDEPPQDGFLGAPTEAAASVSIESDRSETVRLRVSSAADGFVVLTDQFYPGWEATVNGTPRPILRANHAFRAVRVPAGESVVEFRYVPRSLRRGAALSGIGIVMTIGILAAGRRRREGAAD